VAVDIGRVLRLTNGIKASLGAFPRDQESPFSGDALADAYTRFRNEAISIIPQEHLDEFRALFQEWSEVRPRSQNDLFGWAAYSNKAREILSRLGGWLDGYVAQAQMQANAEAYVKAKLGEERGVGFQAPSS
jgi:hypothetical protein